MSLNNLTKPERLALAHITGNELAAERDLPRRHTLLGLLFRLHRSALRESDRADLGYAAKRALETNRYSLAIHLEPLKSAFAKLCPADELKPPPITGRPGGSAASEISPSGR